jgi:hypothetical protein
MKKLNEFIDMFCGKFDNKQQYINGENNGNINNIKARHISCICNDKIINIPKDFQYFFVIEENYYEINKKITNLSRLFLFDINDEGKIRLTSYNTPSNIKKEDLKNNNASLKIDFQQLIKSEKFTPLICQEANGEFSGESVSFFTPVIKFTLNLKITKNRLYVDEIFEDNGKKLMVGSNEPIIYDKILE